MVSCLMGDSTALASAIVRCCHKFFGSVFSELRTIIYTPLSIAFHAVSYVAKGIGYISSFGLIAGVYYLYQSFCAFKSGVPFGEIGEFTKAVGFIVFPFIAYLVSYVSEKIYTYFEENAY